MPQPFRKLCTSYSEQQIKFFKKGGMIMFEIFMKLDLRDLYLILKELKDADARYSWQVNKARKTDACCDRMFWEGKRSENGTAIKEIRNVIRSKQFLMDCGVKGLY